MSNLFVTTTTDTSKIRTSTANKEVIVLISGWNMGIKLTLVKGLGDSMNILLESTLGSIGKDEVYGTMHEETLSL